MKTSQRKFFNTLAAVLIPVALAGCQTGVSPHPFATMFQTMPLDIPVTESNTRPVIPATLSHDKAENPSRVTAAVAAEPTALQ